MTKPDYCKKRDQVACAIMKPDKSGPAYTCDLTKWVERKAHTPPENIPYDHRMLLDCMDSPVDPIVAVPTGKKK
jgi:hypothetical protein